MQNSQQLQSEIDDLELKIAPLNVQLDKLYEQFAVSLVPEVTKWMNNHVRRKVDENATKVNAGGVEPLRQIKAELAELIAQLPKICREAIGSPEQWPHRDAPASRIESIPSGSSEPYTVACFRRAINHLGALLGRHGLIVEKSGHYGEWKSAGKGGYRYNINPGFDARNYPVLKEYEANRAERRKLGEAIVEKQKELEKAKARELWDEA
jgi:hypothetical protein